MSRSTAVWVQLGSLSISPLYTGLAHLRGYLEVQRLPSHLTTGLALLGVGVVYLGAALFARRDRGRVAAALLLWAPALVLVTSMVRGASAGFALPSALLALLGGRALSRAPRWPTPVEVGLSVLAVALGALVFAIASYALQPFLADEGAP